MSFRDCLKLARAQGLLTDQDLAKAEKLYSDIAAQYARDFGPGGSAQEAARMTLQAIKSAAAEKKRKTLLQRQSVQNTIARIEAQTLKDGQQDLAGGLDSLMDADDLNRSPVPAYRQHYEAVLGQVQAKMTGVLEAFRPTVTGGARNRAAMANMVRELFGEKTGDGAAAELAQAWLAAAEYARLRFNAAGGSVGRLVDWGLPHAHDAMKVRAISSEDWIDYILPRLNTERMLDRETGLPFEAEKLRDTLRDVYAAIATDGWARLTPQQRALGSAIAGRRADARFLIFKNADAWMEYNARFGEADAFNSMLSHVDGMARDIAAMELFGPSPTATLHFVEQLVRKRAEAMDAARGGDTYGARATSMARRMWNAWDIMRGNANRPVNARWANVFATARTVMAAAQLGRAALGAISDLNYQRIARQMNGLSAMSTLGDYFKLIGSKDARRQAVRAGLIAENWGTLALAQKRYTDGFMGAHFATRLSHTVLTATGLSPWTQFGKWAFGMEFMGALGDAAESAFRDLPPPLRNALERHGFGSADWDKMRSAPLYTQGGASLLRAEEIAQMDMRLADRLLGMIAAEREYAVPSYSLRGNAMIYGRGVEPGTIVGELARSPFMYKNFGITLFQTHLRRQALEFAQAPGLSGKSRALARSLDFLVSSVAMGALAWQMKQIVAGRDPAPMDTAEFWGAAFMQSGGIGVLSDFFFTDVNVYGRGLPETIGGPTAAAGADVLRLTLGNMLEIAQGKDTQIGRETVDFLRRYMPGGNIWYAQLAVQRLFFDRLALWADPRARERMHRVENKYRNDFGQGLWWRGGQLSPDRAPDFANAVGGE